MKARDNTGAAGRSAWPLTPGAVLAVAALTAGSAGVLATPTARASDMVYVCGKDLCRVEPDGSGRVRLTRDGKTAAYISPTRPLRGGRLAFVRAPHGEYYVADEDARERRRLRYPSEHQRSVQFDRSGRYLLTARYYHSIGEDRLCKVRLGRRPAICHYGGPPQSWGPNGTLLIQPHEFRDEIRMYTWGDRDTPARFVRLVAKGRGNPFHGPVALSPDQRYVAVSESIAPEYEESRIVLFDARSGKRVRDLTRGRSDEMPTFSPDGRSVAFTRYRKRLDASPYGRQGASDIWRVPLAGGRARRVVRNGYDPIWGT